MQYLKLWEYVRDTLLKPLNGSLLSKELSWLRTYATHSLFFRAKTYLIKNRTIQRYLSKSPTVSLISRQPPNKRLWLVSCKVHAQVTNICPMHVIPELKANCFIRLYPATQYPRLLSGTSLRSFNVDVRAWSRKKDCINLLPVLLAEEEEAGISPFLLRLSLLSHVLIAKMLRRLWEKSYFKTTLGGLSRWTRRVDN